MHTFYKIEQWKKGKIVTKREVQSFSFNKDLNVFLFAFMCFNIILVVYASRNQIPTISNSQSFSIFQRKNMKLIMIYSNSSELT